MDSDFYCVHGMAGDARVLVPASIRRPGTSIDNRGYGRLSIGSSFLLRHICCCFLCDAIFMVDEIVIDFRWLLSWVSKCRIDYEYTPFIRGGEVLGGIWNYFGYVYHFGGMN